MTCKCMGLTGSLPCDVETDAEDGYCARCRIRKCDRLMAMDPRERGDVLKIDIEREIARRAEQQETKP